MYNAVTNTLVVGEHYPFLFARIRCKQTGVIYRATNAYLSPEGFNVYTFSSDSSDCSKSFDAAIYYGFFEKYETVQG